MRRWCSGALLMVAAIGCAEPDPDQITCEELCDQLVTTCAYAAFPDVGSCVQGCLYSASVGGDVEGQLDCVFLAQCDTFEIVECEHQYGPAEG
jgi:hypothetical protein